MPNERKRDLEQGEDCRGDYAIFIEEKHFLSGGAELDVDVGETKFFRIIKNGKQTKSHGWAEGKTVVQWG